MPTAVEADTAAMLSELLTKVDGLVTDVGVLKTAVNGMDCRL